MNEIAKKVTGAMLAVQRRGWEQGTGAQALYEAGVTELWVAMAHEAVLRQADDGRLATSNNEKEITDPGTNGEVCLHAYELTGDEYYLKGAQRMLDYLMNTAPRTSDGIIYHFLDVENKKVLPQLWADATYMAPPFLAVMGELEEAVKQLRGLFHYLQDPETKVLFHIYDAEAQKFVRRQLWATGSGWALMGIARVAIQARKQKEMDTYQELITMGNELLDGMLRFQREDGRFHDIMDDKNTFVDGTSAMMMSVYIYRGIIEGWLDKKYLDYAERTYQTMCTKVDEFGMIHEVCASPRFDCQGTSAEGQAAFIMADAWREKALQLLH